MIATIILMSPMINLNPTLTVAGLALFTGQSPGFSVVITHVAFGAEKYDPLGYESALKAELARFPIDGSAIISPSSIQVGVLMKNAAPNGATANSKWIGEIGFYAGDTLFAVLSQAAAYLFYKSPDIDIPVTYVLDFSVLPPGSITVNNDALSSSIALSSSYAQTAAKTSLDVQKAITSSYYGTFTNGPLTRPDGTARQRGDRYFDSGERAEKTWNGEAWYVPNIDTAALATSRGAQKVGTTLTNGGEAMSVETAIRNVRDLALGGDFDTLGTTPRPANSDLMIVRQGGTNKKVTYEAIRTDITAATASSAANAQIAQASAEAARDAAQLSAGIYASTAAGIAATTTGRFFSVPSPDSNFLVLYKNNAGIAAEVARYPTAAEVKSLGDRLSSKSPDLTLTSGQEELLVSIVDEDMRRTWLEARATDGGPSAHATSHMRRAVGLDDQHATQGILAAITDSEGRLTDMTVREEDGQVPEWVIKRWEKRLFGSAFTPGILASVVDAENRMTDLTVRDTDGQVPDWVIARWAPRIAAALSGAVQRQSSIVEVYTPGSDLQPLYPVMTKMAGWGSSSMEWIYPEIADMASKLGVETYFNGGRGGEWSTDSCARMGSIPAIFKVTGGVLPASGAVAVACTNTTLTTALMPYTGTFNGIYGTIMPSNGGYSFTRAVAGDPIQMDGNYPMIPDKGLENRASVVLLWLGKNDMSSGISAADVIKRTDYSFDWLAPMVKRCLVIGQFVNGGTPAVSSVRENIYAVNAQQKARYGELFVDVHEMIISPDVWAKTGITPTQADLDEQAIGNKPPSISLDPGHFNAAGYALVRKALEARMKKLKWYV